MKIPAIALLISLSLTGMAYQVCAQATLELHGSHDFRLPLLLGPWPQTYHPGVQPGMPGELGLELSQGSIRFQGSAELALSVLDQAPRLIPQEILLSVDFDGFRLEAGHMIHDWSIADLLSPADMINPRDLTRPLGDADKLAQLSVTGTFFPDEQSRLELILIPGYRPSVLPAFDAASLGGTVITQAQPEYTPASSSIAGRFSYFGEYADLFVHYAFNHDTMPDIRFDLAQEDMSALHGYPAGTLVVWAPKTAILGPSRVHQFGAGLRGTIPDGTWWLDTNCSIPYEPERSPSHVRRPLVSGKIGVEFRIGPESEWDLGCQYGLSLAPGYESDALEAYDPQSPGFYGNDRTYYETYYHLQITDTLAGIESGISHDFALTMSCPLVQGTLVPELLILGQFLQNPRSSSMEQHATILARPSLTFKAVDGFSFMVSALLCEGWMRSASGEIAANRTMGFSRYQSHNHIALEFSFDWNYQVTGPAETGALQ